MRVINHEQVRQLVPMADCIQIMREALTTLGRGDAVQPLRSATWLPNRAGLLGVMPGYLGEPKAFGLKVVTVFPNNHALGLDSHQGAVLLFDSGNGSLLAVMDGGEITAIRTAAVSAVATDLLARSDAGDVAIIGSGLQASVHLQALALVRKVRRVRVWSHRRQSAQRFAESAAHQIAGIMIEPMATVAEAVDGADIICTVTAATEPILQGRWVAPGAHINAVGACTPNARELDSDAVAAARLFVDWRESTENESGDFRIPRDEGTISDAHILGEIGDLLLDRCTGRESPGDITLFKSLGVAVEDLAMAHVLYTRALERGVGQDVTLGGTPDAGR